MAYALIGIALVLAWLDYLGTANLTGAGSLLKQELFTNQTPFYKWAGAFIIIGLIGYVPELQPFATAMLVLVVVAMILAHAGPVSNLEKAL